MESQGVGALDGRQKLPGRFLDVGPQIRQRGHAILRRDRRWNGGKILNEPGVEERNERAPSRVRPLLPIPSLVIGDVVFPRQEPDIHLHAVIDKPNGMPARLRPLLEERDKLDVRIGRVRIAGERARCRQGHKLIAHMTLNQRQQGFDDLLAFLVRMFLEAFQHSPFAKRQS